MANSEGNAPNLDRDWNININVAGISAPSGGSPAAVTKGHYKVKITDAYVNPERNAGRVVFKLTISEGQFAGIELTDGMSIPKDENDKVRYYWRALAESAGYEPKDLDSGAITMSMSTFKGRDAHISYTPKSESSKYDKVDYLNPSVWAARATSPVAEATSTLPVVDAPAALGSGGAVTKGGVMAKLGM